MKSNPSSAPFAFSHALLDALVKIVDLFLRLVECRLNLLRGKSKSKPPSSNPRKKSPTSIAVSAKVCAKPRRMELRSVFLKVQCSPPRNLLLAKPSSRSIPKTLVAALKIPMSSSSVVAQGIVIISISENLKHSPHKSQAVRRSPPLDNRFTGATNNNNILSLSSIIFIV